MNLPDARAMTFTQMASSRNWHVAVKGILQCLLGQCDESAWPSSGVVGRAAVEHQRGHSFMAGAIA